MTGSGAPVRASRCIHCSSWWDWKFGASYGHRAFTDTLGLLAIFLASFFDWVRDYRGMGEAMSNSLRHSCGQHGLVSLQSNRDGVRVVVEDDGHGFDRDCAGSDGQGLRNMAARASQLNAHLKIHSSPGSGTRVTLEIPALDGEVVR